MAKTKATKAEILEEFRELKKENLKLTNTIHQLSKDEDERRALISKLRQELAEWKDVAAERNVRVGDLIKKLEECEKEKTLIKSQRDVLLKEAEEHLYQINDLQNSFDILQAEVRKIQINEGVIQDQAYEEGYMDARHSYEKAVAARDSEIDRLIDDNDLLHWVLYQIHENQTK